MHVEKITIENYKCFFEKQTIELSQGFNLFIGKNNSGKTTALELLNTPDNANSPHRSELNLIEYNSTPNTTSSYSIHISTDIREVRRIFGSSLFIPLPNNTHVIKSSEQVKEELLKDPAIKLQYHFAGNEIRLGVESALGKSDSATKSKTTAGAMLQFTNDHSDFINIAKLSLVSTISQLTNYENFRSGIYRFSALRTPRARYHMDETTKLHPNAENIAFCINHLQTNDSEGHAQLCTLLNRIFPEIKWIQAPPASNQNFELQCLPVHPNKRRDDLAISIDKMGTGIGNIIAILYVLLTSRFPQIIAIDEPNSFLHPRALRELLQILESHGKQHQYILTGHSPDVLTAIEPSTITYFEMENSSSKIKQFNKNQYHEFRSELSDLGIRMTDLHAKDRVLWVEGQTEEIVFPKLLREYRSDISAGTAVLRVTHTGTFETGKVHINEVANTYKRLTQTSLAPPMIAIVLDTEGRQPQDIQKITRESNNLLHFLPYKMIENYVLDADAILAILKSRNVIVDRTSIEAYLPSNEEGRKNADGAKILKEIFDNLSDSTHEFRKTTHTPELFDWLLENKKSHLEPIELFIESICKSALKI